MLKFLKKTVSIKLINCLLATALVLSLVLLLRIGLYSVPWYDDYSYSRYAKSFQDAYGKGLLNAIRGALFTAKEMWYAWQGTFTSAFLMSLCPVVFGETLYWIGPFFLILILTVSEMVFGYTLAKKAFSMNADVSLCMGLGMSILAVWRIYNANSGFYWYNAGIHYVGMHSFMLFLLAILICICEKKSIVSTILKVILSMALAFILSGGNYVTALQGMLAVIPIAAYGFFIKKRNPLVFLPTIIVYILGFINSAKAPGNRVRAAYFVGSSYSPIMAILKSFVKAAGFLWEFSGLFTIVFVILLAPIIWKGLEQCSYKFRLPGIFAALAFCFYATSFTPTLYAMGDGDIGRVLNAAKLTYQIMLVLTEIYVIGWVRTKVKNPNKDFGYIWYYAMGIAVLLVAFAISPMNRIGYTPYGAYHYVHTGEAKAYYNGYLDMIEEIHNQGDDVRVIRNVFRPAYLYSGELSDDPDYEPNRFMAEWYGKNSIAVKED